MYLLFRYHHIQPHEYKACGHGERTVLRSFMHYEIEKKAEEIEKAKSNMYDL